LLVLHRFRLYNSQGADHAIQLALILDIDFPVLLYSPTLNRNGNLAIFSKIVFLIDVLRMVFEIKHQIFQTA
jgi:hypothetical protein